MEKVKVTLPLDKKEQAAAFEIVYAFGKAHDAAWSTYVNIRNAAMDKYRAACRQLEATVLGRASDAARQEYVKVREGAWDTFCAMPREFVEAWAKSDAASAANPLVAFIVTEWLVPHSDEAVSVLQRLADGGDLVDLDNLAEEHEWCEDWDDSFGGGARNVTLRRFEIVERA